MNAIRHTYGQRFTPSKGVKLNGIPREYETPSKNEQRTRDGGQVPPHAAL
jgi:hypothetical protein